MEKHEIGSMVKRILAAVVMVPIAVEVLYVGSPYVEVLAVIVGGLLAWEWAKMLSRANAASYVTGYMISLAVSLWSYNFAVILSLIVITSLVVWFIAAKEKHRKIITLGVPYISIGISSMIWLYRSFDPSEGFFDPQYNYSFILTLWFFLMVWSMDIGGLVVGCNLKGPKLAPKISPNKTWSGFCGGVLLSVSASIIFMYVCTEIFGIPFYDFSKFDHLSIAYNPMDIRYEWNFDAQILYAVMGGFIAVLAQIGDLIESAIKRTVGVKDSSKLIPGHGGVFDRVDGLIFAAPFVYLFFAYLS